MSRGELETEGPAALLDVGPTFRLGARAGWRGSNLSRGELEVEGLAGRLDVGPTFRSGA